MTKEGLRTDSLQSAQPQYRFRQVRENALLTLNLLTRQSTLGGRSITPTEEIVLEVPILRFCQAVAHPQEVDQDKTV